MPPIKLAGLEPMSAVEWPGKLAAVLFFQGCPWRCRYCHNSRLVPSRGRNLVPWEEALTFLRDRRGFLDAVILSGGEPTFQPRLLEAARQVRDLGYDLALHTNGYHSERLTELLAAGVLSMVSMDVKAPFARYEEVTRAPGSGEAARRSIIAILASGIPHEFRTTYHSDLQSAQDLRTMAADLHDLGVGAYYLQRYREEGSPDMALTLALGDEPDPAVVRGMRRLFREFGLRGFGEG